MENFFFLLLHLHGEIPVEEAPVPQQPCPELDPNDAKDEEDEEAEEEDIAQHGQGVQQQRHQDPHAWGRREKQRNRDFGVCP